MASARTKCHLDTQKRYYVFSASLALTLKELSLLQASEIQSVTSISNLSSGETKAHLVGGGQLLSLNGIPVREDNVFLFDESRALERLMKHFPKGDKVLFKNRGLDPVSAFEKGIELLKPFLVNCEEEIKALQQRFFALAQQLQTAKVMRQNPLLFFLGSVKERLPDILINRDGFVLYLLDHDLIQSYPSSLSYVAWSEILLKKMPAATLYLGVEGEKSCLKLRVNAFKKNYYDICHRFALIPGIGQLLFLEEFPEKLFPIIGVSSRK